jgi:hypothetical protein
MFYYFLKECFTTVCSVVDSFVVSIFPFKMYDKVPEDEVFLFL